MRTARYLLISAVAVLAGYAAVAVKNATVTGPATSIEREADRSKFFRRTAVAASGATPENKSIGASERCPAPGDLFFVNRPTAPAGQAPSKRCRQKANRPGESPDTTARKSRSDVYTPRYR